MDTPIENQCGKCVACKTSCPTGAIVEDGVIDARRCISYLTIEFDGIIPEALREPIGNRIYGCDDCQLVCPYNRYAEITQESDYHCRDSLAQQSLVALFQWDEAQFLKATEAPPFAVSAMYNGCAISVLPWVMHRMMRPLSRH